MESIGYINCQLRNGGTAMPETEPPVVNQGRISAAYWNDAMTLNEEISRMRGEYTEVLKLLERISQLTVKEVVIRTYLSGDTTTSWGENGGGHVERYLR
jgi:hypothetical protein